MSTILNFFVTKHAKIRARQGGKTDKVLGLLLRHTDNIVYVGNGCESWSISNKKLRQLAAEGKLPAQYVEQLNQLVAVVGKAENDNKPPVVTIIPNAGRHYTRNETGATKRLRKQRKKRQL